MSFPLTPGHVADEAEVDGIGAAARHDAGRPLHRLHREGARAVKPHGGHARREQRRARVDVELAGDDHLHHVERLGVGDAAAGDDVRRLPELLLQLGRLRSAAVDDDDALAAPAHLGHVGRDGGHVRTT